MGRVAVERRESVLVGTLENPPQALMDEGMVAGLEALVVRAESEDGVRGVVLTGAHPERFVAHYDIGDILAGVRDGPTVGRRAARASVRAVEAARRVPGLRGGLAHTPLAGVIELERFQEIFMRMNRCGAVFVAAINGSTQGGGCELSLACDVRLMAEGEHVIGQPEILLGFPPGGGGTQRLARLLGSGRALRLVLDGRPIAAAEAAELGLVDEVVKPGELVDRAVAEARRLGARPKAAVAAAKRAIYEGGSLPLVAGMRLERSEFMAAVGSPEAEEAMAAYVAEFERTGELPAYNEESRRRADERGVFGT